MKQYELKSSEELTAIYQRQQRDRNNFDLGDTVKRLLEFFASGDLDKAASVRGVGDRRGTGVMRGGRLAGEANGPTTERGDNGTMDIHG